MPVLTLVSADLDDPLLSDAVLADCLAVEERARAGRYARPELTQRFVAGRVTMRHVLGRLLGVRPADVTITYNAWGKPELAGGPFFNLSHAGRSALFAIDDLAPIGVDIEVDYPTAEPGWFDSLLSPRERAEFERGSRPISALLRLWVRKEAVMKAIGCGLSLAPDRLDVGLREVDVHNWRGIEINVNGGARPYVVLDLSAHEIAAVARMGEPSAHVVRRAFVPKFGLIAQ